MNSLKFRSLIYLLVLPILAFGAVSKAFSDDSGATKSSYVISVDDQLTISVLSHSDMTVDETVTPDGTLNYPVVGTIHAAGMTVAQLEQTIASGLVTINHPHVTVLIRQSRPRKVSVLGSVHGTGQFDWKPGWRVLDAIAAAGGPAQDPVMTDVKLMVAGTSVVQLDYVRMSQGDSTQNLEINPGDIVLVSQRDPSQAQIQVIGEVMKPGLYPVTSEGISVVSLIAETGGPTTNAALSRAQIMHAGVKKDIDLRELVKNVDNDKGAIRVFPGDVLDVPTNESKVYVIGEVKSPGTFPIPDGQTVSALTAIANAGGVDQDADKSKGAILRKGPDGQVAAINISFDKVMSGAPDSNTQLQAGDVLYIPTRVKHASSVNEGVTGLSLAGVLAALFHF